MTTTDKEIIEAMALAMHADDSHNPWRPTSDEAEWYRNLSSAALAAARPLIERAMVERCASRIENTDPELAEYIRALADEKDDGA